MPPDHSEEERWLQEQVLPHEPQLRSWLASRFHLGSDIDDIIQGTYIRVLKARKTGKIRSPKAFVFTTARNLAVDHLRRSKVFRKETLVEYHALSVLDESEEIPERLALNEELEILTQAVQSLPDKCRQIFTLRKVYNMSQIEIAEKLGISVHTVSAQLTIGLKKCAQYMSTVHRDRTQ